MNLASDTTRQSVRRLKRMHITIRGRNETGAVAEADAKSYETGRELTLKRLRTSIDEDKRALEQEKARNDTSELSQLIIKDLESEIKEFEDEESMLKDYVDFQGEDMSNVADTETFERDAFDIYAIERIEAGKQSGNIMPFPVNRADPQWAVRSMAACANKKSIDHLNWSTLYFSLVEYLTGHGEPGTRRAAAQEATSVLYPNTRSKFDMVKNYVRLDEDTGHMFFFQMGENQAFVQKRVLRDDTDKRAVFAHLWSEPSVGSHRGRDALYSRLRKLYVNLHRSELERLIRQTEMNEIRRNERNEAKVVTPLVVTRPMEQLQMDLIDMHAFANKNAGINYVLVIVDCFSKYLWTFPLKNKEAKSVVDSLSALFMRYEGFPRILQSDNGGEFAAKESRMWYESNGIIYRTSRPNRPSTNGQVERTNGTLKGAIISDFIRSGEYSFTNWLDGYVMAYNTMVHTSTGVTPFELHKGRAMSWMPNKDTQDTLATLRLQWDIDKLNKDTKQAVSNLSSLNLQVLLKQQAEAIPQAIRRFATTA